MFLIATRSFLGLLMKANEYNFNLEEKLKCLIVEK